VKIAIIGAAGMLGGQLVRTLAGDHQVLAWDLPQIDITRRAETIASVAEQSPQLIINCAACVNIEQCQSKAEIAWRVNALGSQNLALAASLLGCDYLYFSSDYVFDGNASGDYDELDPPCPVNEYGRSKLAGEVLARQVWPRTYVVRTAWLFGGQQDNYVRRVLAMAQREGLVRMGTDQLESPTYTRHLAEAVSALIATGAYGTYHVTSQGACTRLEFAEFVLRSAGRPEAAEAVQTVAGRTAPRPARTVLNCRLFQLVTGHTLPHWQRGVLDYLAETGR
jgi:dTDP-4-dehydrorhamnose reductase